MTDLADSTFSEPGVGVVAFWGSEAPNDPDAQPTCTMQANTLSRPGKQADPTK